MVKKHDDIRKKAAQCEKSSIAELQDVSSHGDSIGEKEPKELKQPAQFQEVPNESAKALSSHGDSAEGEPSEKLKHHAQCPKTSNKNPGATSSHGVAVGSAKPKESCYCCAPFFPFVGCLGKMQPPPTPLSPLETEIKMLTLKAIQTWGIKCNIPAPAINVFWDMVGPKCPGNLKNVIATLKEIALPFGDSTGEKGPEEVKQQAPLQEPSNKSAEAMPSHGDAAGWTKPKKSCDCSAPPVPPPPPPFSPLEIKQNMLYKSAIQAWAAKCNVPKQAVDALWDIVGPECPRNVTNVIVSLKQVIDEINGPDN